MSFKQFIRNHEQAVQTAIVNIISGIVIAYAGLLIWGFQNATTQEQKFYETRVEVMKTFSAEGGKMISLFEFMVRARFELIQIQQMEMESSENSSDYIVSYENMMNSHILLKERNPLIYDQYMKGLDFQHDFLATCLLSRAFFDSTHIIDSFQQIFSDQTIYSQLEKMNFSPTQHIDSIDREKIIVNIRTQQTELFTKILQHMYSKIEVN
jgi:hypothetical protein